MHSNRITIGEAEQHSAGIRGNGNGNDNGHGNGDTHREDRPSPAPGVPTPRSEAQRRASRQNGARSMGPKTAEGKRISSANALKHGLTSKIFRPPADVREQERVYDRAREGLADQVGPLLFTDMIAISSAASKLAQLASVRRARELLLAPPGPQSQAEVVNWEELAAAIERVELLEARLPGWEAGERFDCTPRQARALAKQVHELLDGVKEYLEEETVWEVTPEERAAEENDALRIQREREQAERELAAREAADLAREEDAFYRLVAKLQEENEQELAGLDAERRAACREAFKDSLKPHRVQHERAMEALRAGQREHRQQRAVREHRDRFRREEFAQSVGAKVREEDERKRADCLLLADWADGYRFLNEASTAALLAPEPAAASDAEIEGHHAGLVNLLRRVLSDSKDWICGQEANRQRLADRADEHLRAQYLNPERLALFERLERHERMIERSWHEQLERLGIATKRRRRR